jgi:hypothetical protein
MSTALLGASCTGSESAEGGVGGKAGGAGSGSGGKAGAAGTGSEASGKGGGGVGGGSGGFAGSSAGRGGASGGSAGTAAGGSGASGRGGAAGAGAGGTAATSGEAGETGMGGMPPDTTPTCQVTCEEASDCVRMGANPPFDDDNWLCDAGHCRWLGCLNDDECMFFGGVCKLGFTGGTGVKSCTEACQNDASVCYETGRPIADDDNWICEDGGCKWLGCLSDQECADELGEGARCDDSDPAATPNCIRGCSAPADCVYMGSDGAHDEDNYACEDGECVSTGCNTDTECTSADGRPSECVD